MRDIYLFNPIKEAKLRGKGKTKEEFIKELKLVNNIYDFKKDYVDKQVFRFIEVIKMAFSEPRFMLRTLTFQIPFRLRKGGKIYNLPPIEFLYFMILVTPLAEKGVVLKDNYIFNPETFRVSDFDDYQNNIIIQDNKHHFTAEEANETFGWIRHQGDKICETLGDRLMQTLSLYDFVELIQRSDVAREIMMVKYDLPSKMTPKEIETLANSKMDSLTHEINQYKGGGMETALSAANKGQYKEFGVLLGNKPDLYGNTLPLTSPTNNIKGFTDIVAFYVDAHGGRKSEVLKLGVSVAGKFERSLTLLCADLKKVDLNYICSSEYYIPKFIKTIKDLKTIEGRYYIFDKKDKDEPFKVVSGRDTTLLNHTVYLKSPMTCSHPDFKNGTICRGCYSELLSVLNKRVHIGMNSAYSTSDDTQQVLLSGKHNLMTDTHDVEFIELFRNFFTMKMDIIIFNEEMCDAVRESDTYKKYSFFFNSKTIKKKKDGEHGSRNRIVEEIVVHNKETDEYYNIENVSECNIYMSSEMNELYRKYELQSHDERVFVPFEALVENPEMDIFEVEFKNNDLIEPIMELDSIINSKKIKEFEKPEDLLYKLIPLFNKAGINMPQIHMEIVISRLIKDNNMNYIDWSLKDPEYQLVTYNNAIMYNQSPVNSIIYGKVKQQLQGKWNFYEKEGTSIYDAMITT